MALLGYLGNKALELLDERYGAKKIVEFFKKKSVPYGKETVWYYFGGITLFLLIIQIVTGILLLIYYKPSTEQAFESVKFIVTKVPFGWLIRSIHSWSANLMVLSAFVHLFSAFFMRSYRAPRELTWVTGAFLFFLAMGFGFTGYLLPWNELAFFATKVGTQIAGAVPFVGEYMKVVLRGGEEISDATITRFFAAHVIVLPLLMLGLVGMHLTMIQIQGMSDPIQQKPEARKHIPFFPDFFLRDLFVWTLVFGFLTALAVLFPWELGKKLTDSFAPAPIGIKPEWYFMFMFQTLKYIPSRIFIFDGEIIGILAFGFAGFLMVMLPFIDIWAGKGKENKLLTALGVFAIVFILVMTALGYLLPGK